MVYASYPGAYGKANVGISNDKGGENPPRLPGDANQPGVSRDLMLSRTARQMADTVNIP